jgi:tetratricopeptide (TPR) repeat protein
MQAERTERLADLVASALECAVSERDQFLSDVCGDDVALREEAESLLLFEDDARDFIETPAHELVPEIVLNGTSDFVTAHEPIFQGEVTADSETELQEPETERDDQHDIGLEVDREETKAGEDEPVLQRPEEIETPPEIPPALASEHPPSHLLAFGWPQRGGMLAAALLVIALVIGLRVALRDAKNARHRRDVMQEELSRTQSINSFLQRVFSFTDQSVVSVWPVAQRRSVTVKEMLDRIAPQVESELGNRPGARGQLLRTIGNAYAAQGEHDAAEKNLRVALAAQTAFYGEQNAEVMQTTVDLGVLLYRREKFAQAERFLEKGATFLRKQRQARAADFSAVKLAYALDNLGAAKFYQGDAKNGRAILEEALQIATQAQIREADRSIVTNIKTDLGGLLVAVGDFRKGETLLRESLAEFRKETNHPRWEEGMTLQMLGELALAKRQPGEAAENFLVAEEIYRETLGDKNLYFARNLERRATVCLMENDLQPAEELARKSLALAQECSPDDKLPWTDSMVTLSSVLIKERRVAEGEDYLRQTLRICEEQPTRNYAAISLAKIRLSQLLLSQDRATEAENLAFEAHSEARQHLELQDPMRKAVASNLIDIYEREQKHEAARGVK